MVGHLSYSQYPMIKKIGNDSLVLMTPTQGVKINKKYTILVDSIKSVSFENKNLKTNIDTLKTNINGLNNKIFNLNNENYQLNNSLNLTRDSLNKNNKDFENYKKKYGHLEHIDLSTKRRTTVGIGVTILTWLTLFIISAKN